MTLQVSCPRLEAEDGSAARGSASGSPWEAGRSGGGRAQHRVYVDVRLEVVVAAAAAFRRDGCGGCGGRRGGGAAEGARRNGSLPGGE